MSGHISASDLKRLLSMVRGLLRADGFGPRSFGVLELKSVIAEVFDAVSDDDENSRAAYEKLKGQAKRRMRYIAPDALKAPLQRTLLGPRHALAWATLDAQANPGLFQAVENVRQHFWGQSDSPFPAFSQGLSACEREALQWLEHRSSGANQTRRTELRVACMAPRLGEASYEFHEVINAFSDDSEWRKAGQPIGPFLRELARRLERAQVQVAFCQEPLLSDNIEGDFKGVDEYLSLGPGLHSVRVPPTGPLHDLHEQLQLVVTASGWWEAWQALHYVMTGYPPAPHTNTTSQLVTKSFHYRPPARSTTQQKMRLSQINVSIEGPVSRNEWQSLLPEVVTASGRRPDRLKETHVALLQLKAQTPGWTWSQRLQLWETWRRTYPDAALSAFSTERLLRKQWALAGKYLMTWVISSDPLKVRAARSTEGK